MSVGFKSVARRAVYGLVLLACLSISGVIISSHAAESEYPRLNIVSIGDGAQETLEATGPVREFLGDDKPVTASGVADGKLYFFQREVGALKSSGVVIFGGRAVTGFAMAAVSPELSAEHVARLLRALHASLGTPDRYEAVACMALKESRNAPAAFWTKGDVTHAVAWIVAADRPGWIEYKSVKKGAIPDETFLFPGGSISLEECNAVKERGMLEFQRAVTGGK
ncbi:hypothetical protein DB345_02680 [Spartobacteria bacterium LR76]|nr:hypothetical protein DB345_02680 [Spartobacteria bacterium LR76]